MNLELFVVPHLFTLDKRFSPKCKKVWTKKLNRIASKEKGHLIKDQKSIRIVNQKRVANHYYSSKTHYCCSPSQNTSERLGFK